MKSKDRVSEFGEVFTSEREVNAMLNLVEAETQRIDSKFLEPACGDGNFLIEVLNRKIKIVRERYAKNKLEYERYAFLSVSSIYGIDILFDNVLECRDRLASFVEQSYLKEFKRINDRFIKSIRFVLSRNILHGDALTLMQTNSKNPIVFSEWCFVSGSKVKRTEYTLANLLAYQPFEGDSLFSDLGEEAFIPHPLRTFRVEHFLEICNEKL